MRWLNGLYVQRFRELVEAGLKVVYAFDDVRALQRWADAVEARFDEEEK